MPGLRRLLLISPLLVTWMFGPALRADAQTGPTCATSQSPAPIPRQLTAAQLQQALAPAPAATGPFDIVIVPGPMLAANPAAVEAFNRAAAQWEQRITDPITVTIQADLVTLEPNLLGWAASIPVQMPYSVVRDKLVADASGEARDALVASLPAASPPFVLPPTVTYNGQVVGTKANFKALGFANLDVMLETPTDAFIFFNSRLTFDFDNRDGLPATSIDFEMVAAHEIGHALGFSSQVDAVDGNPMPTSVGASTLDLFRFQLGGPADPQNAAQFATFARELRPGIEVNFDDTKHTLLRLSTGRRSGDGRQASHWKDDAFLSGFMIGVMDPTANVQSARVASADLLLLDLIGYEIAVGEAPPSVTLTTNGDPLAPVTVAAGVQVALGSVATDADGLGFPILLVLGGPGRIPFLWNFDGATPLGGELSATLTNPLVRFPLAPGEASRTFAVSFQAFDTLGDVTTVPMPIRVVQPTPPSVTVRANGQPISAPLNVRTGTRIQLSASASDPDGLGYPLFNGIGINTDLSFLWNFDGATPLSGDLSGVSPNPLVQFNLAAGQASRTFRLDVTVPDAFGATRKVAFTVNVTR